MVFYVDEGSAFDGTLEEIWEYLDSPPSHTEAHRHRDVQRERLDDHTGRYTWVQDFQGKAVVFRMHWTSFPPVGVAYKVLLGPFAGSVFFLIYTPRGKRTDVSVHGEFVSPDLPQARLLAAVDEFFTQEFEQDNAALQTWRKQRGPSPGGSRSRP
jgi:hypothetical protein